MNRPQQNQPQFKPRAKEPTPLLKQYGRDLCREALTGKLPVVLGRSVELQGLMETLCRWTKRNPLLIGPVGVGKTAVVVLLAQQIISGDVPAPLQGVRIVALQTPALLWEMGVNKPAEEHLQELLREADQDGIILYIEDIHEIVRADGGSKMAALLKLHLSKETFTCIGATTESAYYALDQMLVRQFQPLRIHELSADATYEILDTLRQRANEEYDITFTDQALKSILLLGQQHLRNRYFPDKAIDIFELCLARALIARKQEVTPPQVNEVIERMVGVPVNLSTDLAARLAALKERLVGEALCPEDAADTVVRRLEITMRGLDILPVRPNAVIMAEAGRSDVSELTAQVLTETIYGDGERLITVDMARIEQPFDFSGSIDASGDSAQNEPLPFHQELTQKPWSILHFKNVEDSHPAVDEMLAQAIRAGFFLDAQGRRVYLSDTIVLLTVTRDPKDREPKRLVGFNAAQEEKSTEESGLVKTVARDLWDEIDVVWEVDAPTEERIRVWAEEWILPPITQRYQRQGLEVEWDAEILELLTKNVLENKGELLRGKRMLEEEVLPLLIPYLGTPQKVTLMCDKEGSVHVKAEE